MSLAQIIMSVPKAAALAYAPTFVRTFIIRRFGGKMDNAKPRDVDAQIRDLPKHLQEITTRLKNCHFNQLETLGLYAGGVAVCLAVKVDHETLVKLTTHYLKSRLGFTLAYASPQVANGALRSLCFIAALITIIRLYSAAAATVGLE